MLPVFVAAVLWGLCSNSPGSGGNLLPESESKMCGFWRRWMWSWYVIWWWKRERQSMVYSKCPLLCCLCLTSIFIKDHMCLYECSGLNGYSRVLKLNEVRWMNCISQIIYRIILCKWTRSNHSARRFTWMDTNWTCLIVGTFNSYFGWVNLGPTCCSVQTILLHVAFVY